MTLFYVVLVPELIQNLTVVLLDQKTPFLIVVLDLKTLIFVVQKDLDERFIVLMFTKCYKNLKRLSDWAVKVKAAAHGFTPCLWDFLEADDGSFIAVIFLPLFFFFVEIFKHKFVDDM